MKDNVPLKLLVLVLCCAIILAVVIVAFQVPDEMSFTDILAERFVTAPTEEQVSIQEEEMEVIGRYDLGAFLSVWKIHDNKDNVTCWTTNTEGISCIPDHQLTP